MSTERPTAISDAKLELKMPTKSWNIALYYKLAVPFAFIKCRQLFFYFDELNAKKRMNKYTHNFYPVKIIYQVVDDRR